MNVLAMVMSDPSGFVNVSRNWTVVEFRGVPLRVARV